MGLPDTVYNSTFSYDEAKSVYMKQSQKCKSQEDCKAGSRCKDEKCFFSAYCLPENNMKTCAIERDLLNVCMYQYKEYNYTCRYEYINQDIQCLSNEDCLTNQCKDNKCVGSSYTVWLEENYENYGADRGEECSKTIKCMEGSKCRDGICGPHDLFPFYYVIIFIVVVVLVFAFGIYSHRKRRKQTSQA